jgi:hypothetical protein
MFAQDVQMEYYTGRQLHRFFFGDLKVFATLLERYLRKMEELVR